MCKDLYNVKLEDEDDDDEDDEPRGRRKKRGEDDAESTRNPVHASDEYADEEEDGEDGHRAVGKFKKVSAEEAIEEEKKKKSWCPIL